MIGKKIALIVLAALSLMLPGIAYDFDEAGQDGGGAIQSEPVDTSGALGLSDLGEMLLYENAAYGFRLSYPVGWTGTEPDANDEGIVAGFLAPGEDMDDPAIYLAVQVEELPPGQKVTLDQYSQAVQSSLKSNLPDLEIQTEGDISVGDLPGHAIVYGLEGGNEAFRILKAWTLSGEYAVIFTYSAPDSSYDQLAGDISKIIGSFQSPSPSAGEEDRDAGKEFSDKSQLIDEESDPIQRLKAAKNLTGDIEGTDTQDKGSIDVKGPDGDQKDSDSSSQKAGSERDPVQRLKILKSLMEEGLISQEEYNANKEEILAELMAPS